MLAPMPALLLLASSSTFASCASWRASCVVCSESCFTSSATDTSLARSPLVSCAISTSSSGNLSLTDSRLRDELNGQIPDDRPNIFSAYTTSVAFHEKSVTRSAKNSVVGDYRGSCWVNTRPPSNEADRARPAAWRSGGARPRQTWDLAYLSNHAEALPTAGSP